MFSYQITKNMNMLAILDMEILSNFFDKYLNYEYVSGYFQNMFLSSLFNIIWKIYIFNVGHFGLHIAALMGKFTDGS